MKKNKILTVKQFKAALSKMKFTTYKIVRDGKGRAAITNLTTNQTRIAKSNG